MWCSHWNSLQLLSSLLIIVSQTFGKASTAETCGAWFLDENYILCPPGNIPQQANVLFKFTTEHDRLDITCNKNTSAEQLTRYQSNFLKQKTFKGWSSNLTALQSIGCPAGVLLENERFAGLRFLKKLELYDSLQTLGPTLLSNLVSLEEFEVSRGVQLTSVHESAFRQTRKLRKIKIRNTNVSTIHKDTFKGLSTLELLDLGHNKIETIQNETLKEQESRCM